MRRINVLDLTFSNLTCLGALLLCIGLGDLSLYAADHAGAVKPVYTAGETKEFKKLAGETIAAIDGGNEKQMVAKITDLETAWDAKEETLKPKDPATWTALDKTLDKGISALRSSHTDFKKGKAAMQQLVKMLEQATKPE